MADNFPICFPMIFQLFFTNAGFMNNQICVLYCDAFQLCGRCRFLGVANIAGRQNIGIPLFSHNSQTSKELQNGTCIDNGISIRELSVGILLC